MSQPPDPNPQPSPSPDRPIGANATPPVLAAGWRVAPLPVERRPEAVARLLGVRAGDRAIGHFLRGSADDGTDLSLIWIAQGPIPPRGRLPEIGEAVMVVPTPGRTAMVFVSGQQGEASPGERPADIALQQRAVLLDHACEILAGTRRDSPAELRQAGRRDGPLPEVDLAQSLLDPEQSLLMGAFARAGFIHLANLSYQRRDIPRVGAGSAPQWPAGVRVVRLLEIEPSRRRGAIIEALTASYIDTRDCPALCSMRRVEDVLDSHEAVGQLDPALWFLVLNNGRPEGCMLLTPVSSQETVELVYLGLGPGLRGRGLGSSMLRLANVVLCGRRERTLACAVDDANEPALRLYRNAGFRAFSTRVAFVRPVRRGATMRS